MAKAATTVVIPADDDVEPVAKSNVQLNPQAILPAGQHWASWGVLAHVDHTIDDVLNPRYLFAKAGQIRALDEITIKHPHGLFAVMLDVVRVDHETRSIVAHLRHIFDFTKAKSMVKPDLSKAKVEFLGSLGWGVVDGAHVCKSGLDDEVAASKYLANMRRGN